MLGGGDSTPGAVWRHVSNAGGGDIIILKIAVDIWERVLGGSIPPRPANYRNKKIISFAELVYHMARDGRCLLSNTEERREFYHWRRY